MSSVGPTISAGVGYGSLEKKSNHEHDNART